MADPHHVEALDGFDRLTVSLYRAGVVTSAIAAGGLGTSWLGAIEEAPWRWLALVGAGLVCANLHLYDRQIRWVFGVAGWLGVMLVVGAPLTPAAVAPWLTDAGLGFVFVVWSAVALKERLCFRLPIVVAIPALLASSLVPLRLGWPVGAGVLLVAASAVLLLLAGAKLRMPLHYDIGDKSRYQV